MALPLIDDLSRDFPEATIGTRWELLSDRVMGGVSVGRLSREVIAGRPVNHMRGEVSLDQNGGFIQMALDLSPSGASVDCRAYAGVEIEVTGNDETYGLHLRTLDLARPWQSYRQTFRAGETWQVIRLSFSGFAPYRTEVPLDLGRVRRLGLVAIGRAFTADLALAAIRFY